MNPTIFETRLAETIAWCDLQTLDGHPHESEEFLKRKAMQRQGLSLLNRARLLEKRGSLQSWLIDHLRFSPSENPEELRRQAKALFQRGDVNSIYALKDQLRTASIKPSSLFSPKADWNSIVEMLCEGRAELQRKSAAYPALSRLDLADGKLLRHEPDYNVSDGAAQDITYGYFDLDDTHPGIRGFVSGIGLSFLGFPRS